MRQCRLNFAEHRYDCEAGVIGEHNATELIITPPAIMPAEAVYRLCFEPGGLSEIILQTTDGVFSYPLPASVTSETYCCVTLIGYVGSEQIYKSRMVQLHFCRSAEGDTSIESQKPGIVDEINANTSARHTHTNKSVLDRLSDKDGKLQFDGNAIGGGGGASNIFYIDGTLTVDDSAEFGYDVSFASDVTYEQVDAACKAGKQLVVRGATGENITAYFRPVLSDNTSQPGYYFGLAYDNLNILMSIFRGDTWSASVITLSQIVSVNGKTNTNVVLTAEDINYDDYNTVYALISQYLEDFEAVGNALERLDEEAHTHDNKAVLDGITAAKVKAWDGKSGFSGSYNDLTDKPTIPTVPTALKNPHMLTINVDGTDTDYDGSAAKTVAVKGATKQVTSGTTITLADNTEYRLADVTTLTLTYPTGNFECWMSLTFAASGTVTVTLPTGTKYLGSSPDFKNGEVWEMSIKDGVAVAQKVGDGT